jgi:hypothetical protein
MADNPAIKKTFDPVGRLQLFSFEVVQGATCAHCDKKKKAKKWAILDGDWGLRICNGCYGQVLSKEDHPYLSSPIGLKPGLYTLTKSFKNPHYEVVSHRDLMGVIRALPAGWDWVVHRNDNRERDTHPPISPLMVAAAGGYHCQSMYVYEADYKESLADYEHSEEVGDGYPPLLAPREFLEALEIREADTLTRLKQVQRHSNDHVRFDDSEILDMLAFLGMVKPADVVAAAKLLQKREGEVYERYRDQKSIDESSYSAAVNEVFDETGEHWID